MKWTEEETALFERYDPETIAKITGRSLHNVRAKYYYMQGGKQVLESFYCPVCGKEFFPPSKAWAYKHRGKDGHIKYYCSWHCMRSTE